MKKSTLILVTFLITSLGVFAQQENMEQVATPKQTSVALKDNTVTIVQHSDKVCYAEQSKTNFFEALLNENAFDIRLKNSNTLALRSMEEIIKRRKNQRLYTEAEREEKNN